MENIQYRRRGQPHIYSARTGERSPSCSTTTSAHSQAWDLNDRTDGKTANGCSDFKTNNTGLCSTGTTDTDSCYTEELIKGTGCPLFTTTPSFYSKKVTSDSTTISFSNNECSP